MGAARQTDRKQREEAAAASGIEPGSVHLGDQEIRKAFAVLDLGADGQLTADELKHVFAQLGELPSNGEIEAMLHVCDRRGEIPAAVTYEDFSAVMMHPGEALRRIDSKKLRELMREGKKGGGSDSESSSSGADDTPSDSDDDDDD